MTITKNSGNCETRRTAISAETARSLFEYNVSTGKVYWRESRGRASAGSEAGTNSCGYRVINVHGRAYAAHRIAWLIVHGEWPVNEIDHINGDPSDNRLVNLRPATRAQNCQNVKLSKANKSGVKGVFLHPCGRWYATIGENGRGKSLGLFVRKIDAVFARKAAEIAYGDFRRQKS